MTDIGTRQPGNPSIIEVNGVPYQIASDEKTGLPLWTPTVVPTQRGDPTKFQEWEWSDWSRGMGDSRGLFSGAVETATAYLGRMGHILPPHAVTTVATGHDLDITAIVEVTLPANRVITYGGRYGKELDPSTMTVSTTKDFGAGKTVTDAVLFRDQVAVAMGESVQFQYRDNAGTYAASTTTTDTISGVTMDYRYATAFGISGEGDLMRGRSYLWSKFVYTAALPGFALLANQASWGTEYPIGDQAYGIRKVFSFNRWEYILKPDGLYSFDVDSREVQQIPDLAHWPTVENNNWFVHGNKVFACTYAGLYRHLQSGAARAAGPERWPLNESATFTNVYPTAGESFGEWMYIAFYNTTDNTTYITMARASQSGDQGIEPIITIPSIIYSFTGKCRAMKVLSLTTTPTLAFGEGGSLSYFTLTRDGRPASFKASGTFTVSMSPTDFGNPTTYKLFRRLEVVAGNVSASQNIQFAAAMDGGSFNNVGSALTSTSARYAKAFWTVASNDGGRTMQLKVTGGCNSASAPLDIRNILLSYEERPEMVEGARFVIDFEDQSGTADAITRLTGLEQREAFNAYLEAQAIVTVRDINGETYSAAITPWGGYGGLGGGGLGGVDLAREGDLPQMQEGYTLRRLDYQ